MKKILCLALSSLLLLSGCGERTYNKSTEIRGSMELLYADQFSVDYLKNGCSQITVGEDSFLLIPENSDVPEDTGEMKIIRQPVENIYLASSSVMDIFSSLDSLDRVLFTSTDSKNWTIPEAAEAVSSGDIAFIGKYSSPDYEALTDFDCGLVIENTMVYHSPEVKEKIEFLDIPVIVERSSYESHPLGRMEWIKLYGLLLGKEEEAEQIFNEKIKQLEDLKLGDTKKTAAFFYITSSGAVNIRKPGDYVSKMIDIAGGEYIFSAKELKVDENSLSTMNIDLETFYSAAKDADYLIYSSTIEGELDTIEELCDKSSIFSDFKAVKTGNVWCTGQNMFQQTMGAADMISDLNSVFTDNADSGRLKYLHKLK